MKNLFKSLVVGALLLGSVGCSDMFKEDLYEINNEIDKINQRIDSLCNAVNTNIASLQTIIDVMQDNDYVDSITPIVEGGVTVGYEIVFTQSGSVKIYHGKKGDTGHTPIVGVQQAEDGRWYWTIDGEWLLDGEGDKVLAEAIDGIDGEKGEEGITPKLEVRDNYWYISYDNGATWVQLGKATGENGKDGDSMFKSISYNEDYVELVLADGKTVIKIPTWASHMLLVDEIAKINSNISAIQAAIEALESNDYVQKVTPVKDEEGNVIGYTLQFAFTGDVTIFHGEDGKDGEDGEDGKDGEDGEDGKDGYTPVIGARQHPDGIWYWTVDGEWLLDTNGNRVKTTGDKGTDGTIGITPELKIEDDYWYVSYDKGQTWTKLGKAKGEDGVDGGEGAAGDAFFKDVDVTEDYVTFTLADGTEIKIPTWKVYQELADAVAHLNTNVQSMQTIITAIQNNDFVTGTTEIVDPQTNEVIGYTLHFSKSGDIEIYHGKTPNAPEIGIKKHPQYGLCWTYNGEYIKDPGTGAPVALPKDGASGVTPQFKIVDGFWFVSMDEGRTWQEAGQATGDQGETGATGGAGDSFFKSVKEEKVKDANGNDVVAYIVMTLADGSEYRVPTAYITDELTKRIAAIENQFSIISTIVNALQSAEYIKEVVELYEGPALVGYEITFVKYAIGADGKLTETTRKSTIRNGGAGEAGTVVAAEYDAATDTWYWTLDGVPLKDKDGNYVAINGKNGKPGVTPQMQINDETNFWEVSYDGGNTWESTGVKATGPQGNPGQGGAAGDSFFADVYKDGDYWVFERVDGDKIMVPTAEAFASLAAKVAALDESSKAFASLINGKKFIESCEPFTNDSGSGYKLVLVSLNAETGETVKEDYFIFDGEDAETPIVGLRQDETTGDWYWTVDGEDILVDGKPVKANGPQGIDGPVPSFRIDPTNGHLYVTVNGTESDLGRVVGTNGSAGEAGSSSSIVVTEGEDGQLTIEFIGGDGLTSTIVVPSWDAFVALQETVSALNTNVEALQAAVAALENNDYVKEVVDIIEDGVVVGYKLIFAKGGEKPIYHGKKGDKGDTPTVSINEDGYWVINGEVTTDKAVPQDGKPGATPKFKIVNGDWYYSYEKDNLTDDDVEGWTYVGRATGPQGPAGTGGEAGDAFFKSVSPVGSDQTTTVPAAEAYYISIELIDGTKYLVPTYKTTDALLRRIEEVNSNVESLSAALNAMSSLQHVISYTKFQEDGKDAGYKLVLTDGPDDDTENDELYIYFGKDGAAGLTPTVAIDENGYWVINGETTTYKAVPENGKPGATPKFKIVNGDWYYSYDQDNVDDEVVEGWTYAGRATGPQGPVGEGGQQGDSFFKNVSYEYAKDANGNILKDQYNKDIVAYIVLTLSDESEYKIPTEWVIKQLEDRLEALESQFSALQTIVNAINEHEYVKKIVGVYEGLKLTGYKITFVTYSVAADGSLQESETEKLINFETTANIPVVGAEQDEQTGVWYWTIDGERIKGADGKDVPMQGPQGPEGQPGHTPVITIGENGNWFIDGVDTGKPSQGVQGETGGSGDSFFKSVQYKDNNNNVVTDPTAAYYIEFTLANNDVIKVPTASAFESLITKLGQLEIKVNGLQDAINLQNDALESLTGTYEDFVAGLETKRFAGVPVYNEETQSWVFPVVDGNGKAVENETFSIVQGNVVTIVKDDEDGKYYWAIDGVKTDYPVTGNDGQPAPKPEFQINATTGELEYRFEGEGEDAWKAIGDVVGEDGAPGAPGTNGATNVVFASAVEFDENGAYVSYTKAESADAALWVGVQYGTGEKDFIWMPTYKNFQALAGRVTAVEGRVTSLEEFVELHRTSIESLVTLSTDVNGLIEDVDKLKTYKFIGTPEETENGWKIPVVNGAGQTVEGEEIILTNGTDGSVVTIVKDDEDGKYYWAIDGVKTDYPVTGNNGQPAPKPEFQINATTGELVYRFEGEGDDAWKSIGDVVGEPGANGATNVIFASVVNEDGTFTKVEDASQANWVGIIFVEGDDAESHDDDQIIWVPTYRNFQGLQALVTTLNTNANSLAELIEGKRFITNINTEWSGEVNGVQRTGTAIEYVQIINNNPEPGTMYIYNGLAGANGATVGVAVWAEADGGDGKLYWTITQNNETSWLLNGENKVPVTGEDGQSGTDGKTPEFKIDAETGILYWKYDKDEDTAENWKELGKITGEPGVDALKNVVDNGTYYTITYSDGSTVNVQKWVDAADVKITLYSDLLRQNEISAGTDIEIGQEGTTIYYNVSGSGSPTLVITTDGSYVADTGVLGSIKITPTSAFSSGKVNGKLILFVNYYGTTIMRQENLKCSANVDIAATKIVEASENTYEIDLTDLGLTSRPALGFTYNYNDTADRTGQSDNFVYADKIGVIDENTDKWIGRGNEAPAYNNKVTLTIGANPTNKWRAGMVVVYPSKDSQVELAHIKIIQKPGETNLANPDKLGPDDPANCYIVSEPGRYLIPTYKGNDVAGSTFDFSSIKVHTDGHANEVKEIKHVEKNGQHFIQFDLNMSQEASDVVAEGNTIVVAEDANGVVWSWHLWFCPFDNTLGYGDISAETYPEVTVNGQTVKPVMLNRNLGASDQGADDGMYYRWGDKDPFFTVGGKSDYYGGTETGTWSRPDGKKAMTDPCPPGYKVPSSDVWLKQDPGVSQEISSEGYIYNSNLNGGANILFPFSSYLNSNNTKVTYGWTSPEEKETTQNFIIVTIRLIYDLQTQLSEGRLWTSIENTCLYYGVQKQIVTGKKAYAKPIIGREYEINLETSSYKDYINQMLDIFKEDVHYYTNPLTVDPNEVQALQVRCVAESFPL